MKYSALILAPPPPHTNSNPKISLRPRHWVSFRLFLLYARYKAYIAVAYFEDILLKQRQYKTTRSNGLVFFETYFIRAGLFLGIFENKIFNTFQFLCGFW